MAEQSSPAWNSLDSKFSSVLHTNYAPSTEEMAELKTLLVEPQLELSRMSSEIQQLQAALDELVSKRHRLNAFIDAHHAMMSPVRRLPPETLSEIFIRCLPTDRHAVRSLEEAPLLLTNVCRGWRENALHTPAIWTSLHIVLPPFFKNELLARRTKAIRMWLERSGSLPISLSLFSEFDFPLSPPLEVDAQYQLESFLESLLRFTPKLANLTLQVPPNLLSLIVGLLPERFSSLDSLYLCNTDHGDASTTDERLESIFHTLISRVPRVKRLVIHGFPNVASHYRSLECSWTTLTHLTLHPNPDHWFRRTTESESLLGPVQILDMLFLTPQLQSLDVSVIIAPNSSEPSPSMVFLDHLRELRFDFRIGHAMDDDEDPDTLTRTGALIEERIVCPSLKLISVRWHGEALTEFPFSSILLDKVESLIVLETPMTSAALRRCLSLAPNLISLELHDAGYWRSEAIAVNPPIPPQPFMPATYFHTLQDSHVASLTPSHTNPIPLCPKLRDFTLFMQYSAAAGHREISTDVLFGFIESRSESKMLASCNVFLPERMHFSEEQIRRLRVMRDAGLYLRIRRNQNPPQPSVDLPTTGLWKSPSRYGLAVQMESQPWEPIL